MVFVTSFPKKLSILFFLYMYVCETHVSEDIIRWMSLLSYTMFVHVFMYFTLFTVIYSLLQFITVYYSLLQLITVFYDVM